MRRARFLILLGAIGCGVFELVPPSAQQPSLFVSISAIQEGADTLGVDAILFLGRDSTGNPHVLADSTMAINGEVLLPTTSGSVSTRWVSIADTPASTTPDTLELRFPVVAGMSDRFAAARVVIPTRLNGPNLVSAAGEDLRLRVSPLSTPPGHVLDQRRWILRVGPTCTGPGGFEVQGEDEHPSEARVPWEWIQAPAPFTLEACFRLIALYSSAPPSLASNLVLALEVKWHVQVSSAP